MELSVSGTICQISPIREVTPTFRTRGFVLEMDYEYQDLHFIDYAVLQVVNVNCDLLEDNANAETLRFIVGDAVTCFFKIKGTKHKTNPTYYNNLTVYRIEAAKQEYAQYEPPVTYEQQVQSFQNQLPTQPPMPDVQDDLPF